MAPRLVPALVAAGLLLVGAAVGCGRSTDPGAASVPDTADASSAAKPPEPAAKSTEAITVFAGAAGKPALAELGPMYETKTGAKVSITYGGSGTVLTQFSQEQYGDVYIPGSDDFMDKAERKQAVLPESRTLLVYLVPAICVAAGNPKNVRELKDLAREDLRVVVGQPKSVCLGDIAVEVLTETGLWDKVEPRIASYGSSCEDVLNCLILGEADAVIGWDVFARQQSEKVEMIALPKRLARPRNIPASVIRWSKQPDAAKGFIEFLASPEAQDVFSKHGYTVTPPS